MRRLLQSRLDTITNDGIASIDPRSFVTNKSLTIFGGSNELDKISSCVLEINFESKKIDITINSNCEKLLIGQCVWQQNDAILLFGGREGDNFKNNFQFLKPNTFDISPIRKDGQFYQTPVARELSRSLVINNNVLLIGGNNKEVLEDVYFLEGDSYKWRSLGSLQKLTPNIPYGKFSISLINNKVYLFGGLRKVGKYCEISRDIYTASVESLQKKLTFVKQQPEYGKVIPLVDHEAAVLDDRYLILIGGETVSNPYSKTYDIKLTPNTDIWCYDTKVLQWFKLVTNVTPRIRGGVVVKNSQIYIFGGLINYQTFNTSVDVLQFINFKYDSICTICKNIYQVPMAIDSCSEQDTAFEEHPYQKIRHMNIQLVDQLVLAAQYTPFEAISLLIQTFDQNKSNIVQINTKTSSDNNLVLLQFYEIKYEQKDQLNKQYDQQYLTNICLAALRLGQSFVFITSQGERNLIVFGDTKTNRTMFFMDNNHQYKWDHQLEKNRILECFKNTLTWNEVCSFKSSTSPIDVKRKLIVFNLRTNTEGLELVFDSEDIIYSNIAKQEVSLKDTLSRLYNRQSISIFLNKQMITQIKRIKLTQMQGEQSLLIESIFPYQISQQYNEMTVQIHKNSRFIKVVQLTQQDILKFESNNFGRVIVELKRNVRLNIFQNELESKTLTPLLEEEILLILSQQADRVGDKRSQLSQIKSDTIKRMH